MRLELRFADDIRRVRREAEAARARDSSSRLDAHRRIRATIDLEIESLLAAAAEKRRVFEEDRVEQHRDRERARSREERLRADASRARPAAAPPAAEPAATVPDAPAQTAAEAREHFSV